MYVWGKKRVIHTSFGATLKFRMLYYLDGKVNLFDSDKVTSMEAMTSKFQTSHDSDGASIIEYYSETFKDATTQDYHDVYRKDVANTVRNLIEAYFDKMSPYLTGRQKASIKLRVLSSFLRFIRGRSSEIIFRDNGKARSYYEKTVDMVKTYLKKFGARPW
jgi:hypothetical protein